MKIKNTSTAKRSTLFSLLLLLPIIGLVTYMIAIHRGASTVAALELTVLALSVLWLASYVFNRFFKRPAHTP